MCPKIWEIDLGKIVILSESAHPLELDIHPRVYKYQASSDVTHEVMGCYGEEKYSGLEELMGKSFDHNFSDFCTMGNSWTIQSG